jgi:hypothetical protein
MADPTDADPAVTAAKKIQERITLWKAQEHTTLDVEWVRCRGVVDELKGISSRDALKERFTPVLNRWIPPPRVLHPYPNARFYATHPS